ncbi:hypothetical protein GQ457_08G015360 [Hibiscus cannabinus]
MVASLTLSSSPYIQQHHLAVYTVYPTVMSAAGSSGGHLSTPEGRVGKPARKRSRASRRTPTTLLNTTPLISEPWFNNSPAVLLLHQAQVERLSVSVSEPEDVKLVNPMLTPVPSRFIRSSSSCNINSNNS